MDWSSGRLVLLFSMIVLVKCDTEQDKEKCANDLVGLATCLPYVSGEAKSAPVDCCTGLKQVLQKSPECMCLLVKDRNDPTLLGLKINATLALTLPSQCHAPTANVSDCPALLHLAPNSPDAKVFEEFANSGRKTTNNNSTSSPDASGKTSNGRTADGGNTRSCWSALPMVLGLLLYIHHVGL